MKLHVSFIKSVLALFDEMRDNGISLVYLGEFNHEIIKMFTNMAERKMDHSEEERTTKKKVYHAMIETLQNMNKHSDEISDHKSIGKGLFFIGKKEDTYYIITSNRITEDKMEKMKLGIDEVNNSTKDELKTMFKQQLKEGSISDKGGAGLGLIDIARKTGEKIDYQFLPLDEKDWFFIFKVEINAKKLST